MLTILLKDGMPFQLQLKSLMHLKQHLNLFHQMLIDGGVLLQDEDVEMVITKISHDNLGHSLVEGVIKPAKNDIMDSGVS